MRPSKSISPQKSRRESKRNSKASSLKTSPLPLKKTQIISKSSSNADSQLFHRRHDLSSMTENELKREINRIESDLPRQPLSSAFSRGKEKIQKEIDTKCNELHQIIARMDQGQMDLKLIERAHQLQLSINQCKMNLNELIREFHEKKRIWIVKREELNFFETLHAHQGKLTWLDAQMTKGGRDTNEIKIKANDNLNELKLSENCVDNESKNEINEDRAPSKSISSRDYRSLVNGLCKYCENLLKNNQKSHQIANGIHLKHAMEVWDQFDELEIQPPLDLRDVPTVIKNLTALKMFF